MKEEFCQSCGNRLRFPESARKVICDSCDSEWMVVRTGGVVSLAAPGTLQTAPQEATLQMRLKEVQRQVLIKEDHMSELKHTVDGIVVEFTPVPIGIKLGAVAGALFFAAGAGGAWFFKQPVFIPGALGAMALAPIVGAVAYGRQINQAAREKLLRKKELLHEMVGIKKEIATLKAQAGKVREEAVIEE